MLVKNNPQILLLLSGVSLILAVPIQDSCQLPNCRRPSSSVPGSLRPNEVPQMIVLTFDDGVSADNLKHLNQLFGPEYRNPNGCPMLYTFFATDADNNYNVSAQLGKDGHELASHSLTHRPPRHFWTNISAHDYQQEMVGMKHKLTLFSNVTVSGARNPFLEVGGDASYEVLQDNGFVWDSSMLVGPLQPSNDELPVWPFTLDEPVTSKYCVYGNCPTGAYPGLWEFPLNRIYNKQKEACSLVDDCRLPPNPEGIHEFLSENFYENYYKKNRAPFGIFLHMNWLRWSPILESTKSFLREVSKLEDVYVVTVSQAIEWVKNPTSLSEISKFQPWTCKL